MASFNLNGPPTFPNGTSVAVYPLSNWNGASYAGAAPVGSATETQTVASGVAAYTALAADTRYVAYALVGGQHRYVKFSTLADYARNSQSAGSGSGSGLPSNFTTRTSAYTAAVGDFVLADASAGAFQVTLPAGAAGDLITVKKVDGTANAVAVDVAAGGTIDGDAGGASIVSPQFGGIFECSSPGVWQLVSPLSPGGSNGVDGADGADGADGRTVLNGTGAPGAGLGADGDFYIDTAADAIYGPKTAGAWGSATSLIGPAGANGSNGADGVITEVQNEGVALADQPTMDFVGAGVDVAVGGGKYTVTIGGGGSGISEADAESKFGPQIPALVLPALFRRPLVNGSLAPVANRLMGMRVIIPRDGFLRDVSFFTIGATGNFILAVYDTGDASAGNRTKLADSGSTAVGAVGNIWKTWDPGASAIAVTQGQQLDFALIFDAVNNYGRGETVQHDNAGTLPSGFNVVAGGAEPKLKWQRDVGSFTVPATLAEADAVAGGVYPMIIARVA